MSELAKRWAVAGVGIPVILALLYVGGWPLAVPVAVIAALGAHECYRLAEHTGLAALTWLGEAVAAAMVLLAAWRPTFTRFAPVALGLIGATVVVALVTAMATRGPTRRPLAAVSVTVFGAMYGGLGLAFVPMLHALAGVRGWTGAVGSPWGGLLLVALPLAATWLGDALALFAGTAWGHGGLAPSISPNKSWIGVWAGLGGAGAAGVIWLVVARAILPGLPATSIWVAAVLGVMLGICAILGDLVESLLKRDAGVKDSGRLFPGHGGVLDRLDALLFTLPAAYVALVILESAA
jgi:phosphatidate cytidylyltransferase